MTIYLSSLQTWDLLELVQGLHRPITARLDFWYSRFIGEIKKYLHSLTYSSLLLGHTRLVTLSVASVTGMLCSFHFDYLIICGGLAEPPTRAYKVMFGVCISRFMVEAQARSLLCFCKIILYRAD